MNPTPSQAAFRESMSLLSAAVNVITTDGDGGRHGVTASAVCSVTDTPPTLLVCINRKSSAYGVLLRNKAVCVNILPADLEYVARDFAGMTGLEHERRFDSARWHLGRCGLPVLEDALASLEGRIVNETAVGTHAVMFIEVDAIRTRTEGDGLAYFGREFHRIVRASAGPVSPN